MAMVIGLKSGREFLVADDSYLFFDKNTGLQPRMFITLDRKRIVTIPPDIGNIEFFDEPATEGLLTELQKTKLVAPISKTKPQEVDVNVS